jgi:hypothetical protein
MLPVLSPLPQARRMLPLPMLLLPVACKQPSVVTVGGASADVRVELVNPTSCDSCDPFEDVDTLRVEVWMADVDGVEQRVASDSFAYPDEEPVVSGIEGFGVARIALVGLSNGRVVSAGRTLPIALGSRWTRRWCSCPRTARCR